MVTFYLKKIINQEIAVNDVPKLWKKGVEDALKALQEERK